MEIALQAVLPSGEMLSVEVNARDTVGGLRDKVASAAGLEVGVITLWCEGSQLGGDSMRVCEYPLQDQSVLEVVLDTKQAALMRLAVMGYEGKNLHNVRHELEDAEDAGTEDSLYGEVLREMSSAGMCTHEETVVEVLLLAASHGLTESAEVLLTLTEIDASMKGVFGHSALHVAAEEGHIPLVSLLLAHGADLHSLDYYRCTPLHHAAENGHTALVSLFHTHGADLDARDEHGLSPLHFAMEKGHAGVVAYYRMAGISTV